MQKLLKRNINAHFTNDYTLIADLLTQCEGETIPQKLEDVVADVLISVRANMPQNKADSVTGCKQAAAYVAAAVGLWYQAHKEDGTA